MNHNFFKGINFNNIFFEKVPEHFKKSISDNLFIEKKMSFHEELYTTDDTENENEDFIENSNIKKQNFIPNFSWGYDFCIVKFDKDIFLHDNYY